MTAGLWVVGDIVAGLFQGTEEQFGPFRYRGSIDFSVYQTYFQVRIVADGGVCLVGGQYLRVFT